MTEMDHMNEGLLQAIIDGELDDDSEGVRHVAGCEACAAALERQRERGERVARALALLDTPAPLERARSRVSREVARRRQRTHWHLARAAILVLGFAGVLSAAIPGSPVRQWLVAGWNQLSLRSPGVEAPAASAEMEPEVTAESPAGVSIEALDEVRVSIRDLPPDAEVSVRLVPGARAGIYSTEGQYRSGPGTIEVTGPGSEVRVELPRTLARASVLVDGTPYLRKTGDALEVLGPGADTTATEIRFRSREP